MEGGRNMINILSVISGSPADKAGIRPGESVISINGEPVLDEIDYQDLILHPHLEMEISGPDGQIRQISVAKSSWEPLGLCLDESIILKPRQCRNHCVFCFIDQMPPGMRKTLYVKDDDWRLSLMMGNFVTLTNVDDAEFERILRRKASPLYISVHATDPDVRVKMLRNPKAGNILERLTALKNHGLQFHAQIVLCPEYNGGEILKRTIEDLASLWPAALSVAIVPVGVTRFRERLAKMELVDSGLAAELIRMIGSCQAEFLKEFGTRFVFLSDEFYCLSGQKIPDEAFYEDYPQIENGVGMIRQLEEECENAFQDLKNELEEEQKKDHEIIRLAIPTGASARPHIEALCRHYAPEWVQTEVIQVVNRFFGETITVTGLIVGRDLIESLKGKTFDSVLISESMLRENTNQFLDDLTLEEVCRIIGKPVRIVPNNGESLIRALYQMEEKHE